MLESKYVATSCEVLVHANNKNLLWYLVLVNNSDSVMIFSAC